MTLVHMTRDMLVVMIAHPETTTGSYISLIQLMIPTHFTVLSRRGGGGGYDRDYRRGDDRRYDDRRDDRRYDDRRYDDRRGGGDDRRYPLWLLFHDLSYIPRFADFYPPFSFCSNLLQIRPL